jgi:hypothetical protein
VVVDQDIFDLEEKLRPTNEALRATGPNWETEPRLTLTARRRSSWHESPGEPRLLRINAWLNFDQLHEPSKALELDLDKEAIAMLSKALRRIRQRVRELSPPKRVKQSRPRLHKATA